MTPRGVRVRLAILGLGSILALGFVAPTASSAPPGARSGRPTTIYHKSRSFRIPFNIDPAERARIIEVQLWVSDDSGFTWKPKSKTTPDRPSFTFRAARDAEYWFAVRTLDNKGRLYPGEDEQVEPSMVVVVDTSPPSLVLEPEGRRGSLASVRWEIRDANLDLASFALEYQVEGAEKWRRVPIRHPALIGSESWDAQTAEPLKVRATVADKAGNVAEAPLSLLEGTPTNPGLATSESSEFAPPPPISRISAGSSFPPVDEPPGGPGGSVPRDPFPPPAQAPPIASDGASPLGTSPDPFPGTNRPASPSPPNADDPGMAGPSRTKIVNSPRFAMQYAVDDGNPNSLASVELWVTQNGGQSWSRLATDPDKTSPFEVDLGGDGTFGLRLVARGLSGLGDPPPAPNDPPLLWVEVDSTPPSVQLLPHQLGTGPYAGKVAINWRATDLHLAARPVTLSWRAADQPGARWVPIAEPMENTGQYVWAVPLNVPPRFLIRVDVLDTAGNHGSAETPEPIAIDRARPRSRILSLDPIRTGARAVARPFPQ